MEDSTNEFLANERIATVLKHLKTDANRFAVLRGINRMTMYCIVKKKRRTSAAMLVKLCQIEPRISAEYLLRGEGEPLRSFAH